MRKITTEPAQATYLTREDKLKMVCKKLDGLRRLGQITRTDLQIDRYPIDISISSLLTSLSAGGESNLSVDHLEKLLKMDETADARASPTSILMEDGFFPTFPVDRLTEGKAKSVSFRSKEKIVENTNKKKEGVRFQRQEDDTQKFSSEELAEAAPFEEIESNLADIRILMHELYADVPPSDHAFDQRMPHEYELPDLKPIEEAVLLTDDSESSELTCPNVEEHKRKNGSGREDANDYVHPASEDKVSAGKMKRLKLSAPEYKESNDNDLMDHMEKLDLREAPRKPRNKSLDFADLDYVAIMNAYEGNWAVDEDAFLSNLYFKFVHDSRWRRRIKKYGCFCLIDECTCGRRQELTDAQMAKQPARHFFELETQCDFKNVVAKIRRECQNRVLVENNVEFLRATNPDNYSDSEESEDESRHEPTKEELEREECLKEIRLDMGLTKPFKFPDDRRIRDDESIVGLSPRGTLHCAVIPRVKFSQDIAPPNEWKDIQEKTVQLYVEKIKDQQKDERLGIKWRGKNLYSYKWPRFGLKGKK